MAGELGHVHIPMAGLLVDDQPIPGCNCGFVGEAESVASLTGIENDLLPYWLTQFPDHPLGAIGGPDEAGRRFVPTARPGDKMALRIFEQQAMALGRLFTIAANYTDPSVYFLGGGVVESTPAFRDWFMGKVGEHTVLRDEQMRLASFAVVPDLDMAGARALPWRL
jgi:glucokinase